MNLLQRLSRRNNKKGFTLVELIVVLVILAILAAILVPALLGYIDEAKGKQDMLDARSMYIATQAKASEMYAAANEADDSFLDLTSGSKSQIVAMADVKDSTTVTAYAAIAKEETPDAKLLHNDYEITAFVYYNSGTNNVAFFDGKTWATYKIGTEDVNAKEPSIKDGVLTFTNGAGTAMIASDTQRWVCVAGTAKITA